MCRLEVPEAAAEAGQVLMVVAEGASVTSATWGYQSYLECAGEADGGAACAGLADETSIEGLMPSAAVEWMMGAGCKEIAGAQVQKHRVCSTSTEASGWAAGRRSASHAGHAVATEQMQEN